MATISTAPPQKQKESWGCWGCGCGLLALVVVLVICLTLGGGYFSVRNLTDATSTSIPQFDGGDAVYRTANQKVTDFRTAMQKSQPVTLHLNSDEINTLIAHNPDYAKLRGHLFIKLTGDQADIQASVPVSMIETKVFADRFLNVSGSFGLSFDPSDKTVNLDLRALSIKGTKIPSNTAASFNQSFNQSFNAKIQADPNVRAFLDRAQKIGIENGELVIETK